LPKTTIKIVKHKFLVDNYHGKNTIKSCERWAQMGAADDFVFPPGQHLEECSRVGGCSTGARVIWGWIKI
jgi:hypothetical protein